MIIVNIHYEVFTKGETESLVQRTGELMNDLLLDDGETTETESTEVIYEQRVDSRCPIPSLCIDEFHDRMECPQPLDDGEHPLFHRCDADADTVSALDMSRNVCQRGIVEAPRFSGSERAAFRCHVSLMEKVIGDCLQRGVVLCYQGEIFWSRHDLAFRGELKKACLVLGFPCRVIGVTRRIALVTVATHWFAEIIIQRHYTS